MKEWNRDRDWIVIGNAEKVQGKEPQNKDGPCPICVPTLLFNTNH